MSADNELEQLRAKSADGRAQYANLRKAFDDTLVILAATATERDALKSASEDAAEAITVARRIMACSSHDWSVHPDDVRLYAILVGWDCELPEHADGSHDEIDCSGPNHLDSFAERFGWTKGGVAKLRAQRKAVAALAATKTPGGPCVLCGGTGVVPGTEEPDTNTAGEPCDCHIRGAAERHPISVESPGNDGFRFETPSVVHVGICCDMHNVHCEPPGDLCCYGCTEAGHPEHPRGVRCVLDVPGGAS